MRFLQIVLLGSLLVTGYARADTQLAIFDQTTDLVQKKFYDQTFKGLPWKKLVEDARSKLTELSSDTELEETLNTLLGKLHASHTEFLSSSDQEYWGLKSIFSGEVDGAKVKQIGAWFVKEDGHWFVRDVFAGGPADQAGLMAGDEIVSVNGVPLKPVDAFSEALVNIEFRRQKDGKPERKSLNPVLESFQRSMLRATESSFKVTEVGKKRIAYFHLWSGTNDESKEALKEAAKRAQAESDVLILDLRNGFGGAYPAFLDPFLDHNPEGLVIPQLFRKPMIVLINDGVRSGKEWLADIFKDKKRATLIGTRTKGYFLSGMPFDLKDGRFLLYLAVKEDPKMPKLENNGVDPDFEVKQELAYSAGKDAVLEEAMKRASKL